MKIQLDQVKKADEPKIAKRRAMIEKRQKEIEKTKSELNRL